MLKEFEVSSAEAAFYPEWRWLPNTDSATPLMLPKLETLTLQYTPFKWSSPMLRTNLRHLNLRALPTSHLPLDRILCIIAANTNLESLSLYFTGVLPVILPLAPTSLPELKSLCIGGHYLLSQLVDVLVLPSLDTLTIDIEARESTEDIISNLLTRSNNPPLAHLSLAYGSSTSGSAFYYGPGGILITWTAILTELTHLKSLHIGGTPLEPLLMALGTPDDDMVSWACPQLEVLGMRNCHAHSEGVSKLVQMVDARNPEGHGGGGSGAGGAAVVNGVSPAKLKKLELHDCASLGQDVLEWLQGRIEEVLCTEPPYERSVNSW